MNIELNLSNLLFIIFALVSAFWTLLKLHAARLQRDLDGSIKHAKAGADSLGKHIADHASRLAQLESDIKHVPTALISDIKAMQATQEATHRELHGMRLSVNRLEDFLLKK